MSQDSPLPPTYGDKLSPFAKSLMKALGGDVKTLSMTGAQISRWGLDRPEGIMSLLGDEELAEAAIRLPEEMTTMSETQLAAQVPLDRVDRRMRIHFWEEYENAAKSYRKMEMQTVAAGTGAVSWESYKQMLIMTPGKLAWLFNPPAGYKLQLQEAQELGLSRLMEILELPIKDPLTQRINVGVAAIILQAWKSVDMRVNGALTQRIVQLSGSMGEAPQGASKVDMAEVDKKLAELEALLGGGTALAKPVEPKSEPLLVPNFATDGGAKPKEGL
jgi:hypothetical protein